MINMPSTLISNFLNLLNVFVFDAIENLGGD
jgi:hypothetical protein